MSEDKKEDKKPKTERREDEKVKGMVIVKPRPLPGVKPRQLPNVKPRQEAKPETEKKEDIKRRINEELEFLIEAEDKIPRKEEKEPVDYDIEQMIEECVDRAMAELRRALPPEELEIYEKCYRIFKGTSSKIIRDYAAEQIFRRTADLRGEK
jgi:DNA-binding transcriptional regulator GbsR (MarR family)